MVAGLRKHKNRRRSGRRKEARQSGGDGKRGVEPGVAIGEVEQIIANRFQHAEVADRREPWGALLGDRRAEAAADAWTCNRMPIDRALGSEHLDVQPVDHAIVFVIGGEQPRA